MDTGLFASGTLRALPDIMKTAKELDKESRRGPEALATVRLKMRYRDVTHLPQYGSLRAFALTVPEGVAWLERKRNDS